MARRGPTIGFDRKIQLNWLEATANWAAQGMEAGEIRSLASRLLEGAVAGEGPHSARGKTLTVLLRIWLLVPDNLVPLRDEALALLRRCSAQQRLVLHWGMCLASYPFFRDVASTAGRLLALQGRVSTSQITRRVTESWGERSTVVRAVQRVIRSFVLWGVLKESGERGIFKAGSKIPIRESDPVGAWLLEAGVTNTNGQVHPFRNVVGNAAFFPFALGLSSRVLSRNSRLEVHRQGMDEEMVVLKAR